jgi:hypothetical protein
MKKFKPGNWRKYTFEFFSIFIAVITAFALNNWNDNRKADKSENKILIEISNGLEKDIEDIRQNILGHKRGLNACYYFRNVLAGKKVNSDSLMIHYSALTRDFISIQNTAGYETLKSRGLELIENDSLRLEIITLYEYNYNILRKLEEEYMEMQFQENYFVEINRSLAPNFQFDANKKITGIDLPLKIPVDEEKTILLYLWKIKGNRVYILDYYSDIEKRVTEVQKQISKEIKS